MFYYQVEPVVFESSFCILDLRKRERLRKIKNTVLKSIDRRPQPQDLSKSFNYSSSKIALTI